MLGPVEVRSNDDAVVELPPRSLELLAALVTRVGETVSSAQLSDMMWGSHLPRNPKAAIQTAVSRLRSSLPEHMREMIETTGNGYRLLPDIQIDSLRFEHLLAEARSADSHAAGHLLREALALWRGDPYESVGIDSVMPDRVRLDELRFRALDMRIEADLQADQHEALIPELSSLTVQFPYREPLWGQLMIALYGAGRQADALATFQRARHRLVEDLGVEPGPGLRRIEEAILQQDTALARGPRRTRSSRLQMPHTRSGFIGRREELETLEHMTERFRLVTLTGPDGIGKSRLAIMAALQTARELPDPPAFVRSEDGWRADDLIFELRDLTTAVVLDGLTGDEGAAGLTAEVLRRCPGIRVIITSGFPLGLTGEAVLQVPPMGLDPPTPGEKSDAARLFIDRADDALLKDVPEEEKGRLVEELVRELDGMPLAIELAARRNSASLDELIAYIRHDLRTLTANETAASRPTRTLQASVGGALQRLSVDALGAVTTLASLHNSWDLELAAQLLSPEHDPASTETLVSELVDRSIVLEVGPIGGHPSFRIPHVITRAVRDSWSDEGASHIRERHARAVAAVVGVDDMGRFRGKAGKDLLERVGRSFDDLETAIQWLLDQDPDSAAGLVAGLFGFWMATQRVTEAEHLARLCLDATSGTTRHRAMLHVLLGWAVRPGGDLTDLATIRFTHPFHRLRSATRLPLDPLESGRRSVEALRTAMQMFAELELPTMEAAAAGVLAESLGTIGRAEEGFRLLDGRDQDAQAPDAPDLLPLPFECSRLYHLANLSLATGRSVEAAALAQKAIDGMCTESDPEFGVMILDLRARAANAQGDFALATRLYERATDLWSLPDEHPGQALLQGEIGFGLIRQGYFESALRHLGKALEIGRLHGLPRTDPWVHIGIGTIEMIRGRSESARRTLEDALSKYTELDDSDGVALALAVLGMVHELDGAHHQAIGFHRRCVFLEFTSDVPLIMAFNGVAGYLLRQDRPFEAARLIGASREMARSAMLYPVDWMPARHTERTLAQDLEDETLGHEFTIGAAWSRAEAVAAVRAML